MLLTRIVRFARKVRGDESGVALAAVMGLMLVGVLLSALILSSVVTGLGSTTATRASVQSEAAAESGIDVAFAAVSASSGCTATYASATAPAYSATVTYTTAASLTTPGLTWVAGCPTASATFVKVTSVGTPSAVGVARNTSGDSRTIEAIYARPVASSAISASGPAIYSYSSQSFSGSGTLVSQDGTNDANVMIKTGDVTCSGGAAAHGDLVVNSGNLTLSGSCGVTGNVWASGSGKGVIALSGGVSVGGNAVGNGLTISSGSVGGSIWTTGDATMSSATVGGGVTATAGAFVSKGSNKIGGSTWSSGASTMTNGDAIKGDATAQTLNLTGGNIGTTTSNQAWSRGAVSGVTWYSIQAHLTAQSVPSKMTAKGGITVVPGGPGAGPSAPAAPVSPIVPNWINLTYKQSDWAGFGQAVLGSTCDYAALQAAVNSFGTGKGVLDARACSAAISVSSYQKLALNNDLAIISTKGFSFGGSGGFSSANPHNLWLITEDTTVESPATPTCPTCSKVDVGGGFTFDPNLSTMIYSPCVVTIASGIKFYGQIFAGTVTVAGGAYLYYTPVGLPGYDLNTGSPSSSSSSTTTWSTVSNRNLAG